MSVAAVEANDGGTELDATGPACTIAGGGFLAGVVKNEVTEGVAAPVAASRCFLLSA